MPLSSPFREFIGSKLFPHTNSGSSTQIHTSQVFIRYVNQNRMTIASTGGALPEQPDPARFRRMPDGRTGCWLKMLREKYSNQILKLPGSFYPLGHRRIRYEEVSVGNARKRIHASSRYNLFSPGRVVFPRCSPFVSASQFVSSGIVKSEAQAPSERPQLDLCIAVLPCSLVQRLC